MIRRMENVSPLLDTILGRILTELKSFSFESLRNDFLFLRIVTLTIESGFLPMNDDDYVIRNPMESIGLNQLSKWKLKGDIFEVNLVLAEFNSIPSKLIMIPLGRTALVNMLINDLSKETYTMCIPIDRYICASQTSKFPVKFQDPQHLVMTFKNSILCPIKSRILSHCGYPSASLVGIPEDIFLEFMLYLPISDIINVSKASKRCNSLVDNDILWHKLYKRDFNNKDMLEKGNWKNLYKEEYISKQNSQSYHFIQHPDFISYTWATTCNRM